MPADQTERTLRVFVTTNRSVGQLKATLSDGSAPEYSDTVPYGDAFPGVYTITYKAASPGQTLHVTWAEVQDDCSDFRCDNAALYAVTLDGPAPGSGNPDGASADLKTSSSVVMSGASDPLTGIPLSAFAPVGDAATQTVNGAPINSLPINSLPINTLPINTLPINTLPINTLPINTLPINTLPINTLPINTLPINTLGGWTTLLSTTPLAGVPLQTITLSQVRTQAPTAYDQLHLGDLDVSQSALGRVSLGALALGAAPINSLGLSADDLAALTTWCAGAVPVQCTATPLASRSLFELSLEGAPINTLPINTLPINSLPINTLPINTLPINTLDVSASPINTLPINTLPINTLDVFASPINTLSLRGILAAGSPSPFGAITIGSISHLDQVCAAGCPYATLADAFANGAILSSARLGDILDAVGSLTLGDLHFYGSLTIGDLEQSLPGTTQFGDLLGLLIRRSDVPWESLPARALSAFDASRPELALTAHFSVAGLGVSPATVKVALPDGFDYVPGSATLTKAGEGAQVLAAPVVGTHSVTWSLPAVTLGDAYVLAFHAYSGTTVGAAEATETVTAGSSNATSTASFAVADSFEPNDNAAALTAAQTISPDQTVEQSALASAGDVDYYRVPMPSAGTRIHVHLANLGADYDLALYANQTTSVRTAPSTGAALQDGTVADQSIDLLGGTNPQLTPTALQDVPDPGIPVVQVSANRGTDDEDAGMISPGGGGYLTIAVFGYNGASSSQPYSLRVTTTPAPAPTCAPRSFPAASAGQGTSGSLPTTIPADLNTVFLVDEKRLGDTYGSQGQSDVVGALTRLAGERSLGVSGAVIPVEALAQSQYDAWDANPCNNDAANAVANAIANEVATLKASHASLKYVVFVGGDDQVPFFRVPDLSRIANENGFAGAFHGNEYAGALSAGDLLSDNPYLDTRPIPAGGRQLFVPDLVGGRLVEKPAQIVGAITRYESSHGRLDNSSAFVSGYDFVTDGAQRVQQNLSTALGAGALRQPLFGDGWSKTDLLAAAFPAGGPAAINSWNGHYDNYEALAANGDHSSLLTTADLAVHPLSGGIFFTMGCHAGFQTTDAIVGGTAPDGSSLDWAEAFAQSGTGFVGNTGFGLGNTDSVAFSEELMADFATHLNGALSIGEALARAKQDYYLGRTAFSSYDEKTLTEAELYGLPMYGVGTNAAPLSLALAASPDPVTGALSSTSPTQGSLAPLAGTTAQVAGFDVTPHFEATPWSGVHGQYFTNGGQVQAPNYRPLQPFVTLGAARSGLTAHGVLIDALSSSDVPGFNPDNVRPTVDLSANEPEPQFAEEAWPEKVPTLVSLSGAGGLQQSLNLTTGQFFTDADTHSGVERLWTHVGGRVTYSTSSDFTPPSIDSVDAFVANGLVTFTGHFSDLTETGAAGTVALAQVVYDVDGAGHWHALPLQLDPTTGAWSGGAAFGGRTCSSSSRRATPPATAGTARTRAATSTRSRSPPRPVRWR